MSRCHPLPALMLLVSATVCPADEPEQLPLLVQEDFESGADRWQPSDAAAWKIKTSQEGSVYSQFKKRSDYRPPHRSPFNMAILKQPAVADFELRVRVLSTHTDYGHRDVCLFFGYQDPAHFYYVHLGKKTDDHANQIFIVNGAPRTKISTKTTPGTNWDERWHDVKIVRKVDTGAIAVYFDDMKEPVMTATDTTFAWGKIGLGSFDDTGDWDDLRLWGKKVVPEDAGP